jgi:hypothetical protein
MTLPYFCIFVIIPPLKRTWTFIWINLNSHHARYVCTEFDWNWTDERFFPIYKNSFPSVCLPPWPSGTIIWTSFNLHNVRKLSCKYELFWLSGSQGKFFNDLSPFLHFYDYLPFEEDLALYMNNLEFPILKDALYQDWLKLACWFWRRFFFLDLNTGEYGFPIVASLNPGDHDLKKLESTLY